MHHRILIGTHSVIALSAACLGVVSCACAQTESMFVANFGNNTISRILPDGTVSTYASGGLNGASGLALDRCGNLFVASFHDNTVVRITPSGSKSVFSGLTTGTFQPQGLAVDLSGNLYATVAGGYIVRYAPDGTGGSQWGPSVSSGGIAFDSSGFAYAENDYESVVRIAPNGSAAEYYGGVDLSQGMGVAVDSSNHPYVADSLAAKIYKYSPTGVTTFAQYQHLFSPRYLAFDSSGFLYVTDSNQSTVVRFAPDGSNSVFASSGLSAPFGIAIGVMCDANCDGSTTPPILNANDFICFLSAFAAGNTYANCDGSTTVPVLTANDFLCFLNKFVAGCP